MKELAKSMAKPCKGDWIRLKRLGRYLAGTPRMQVMMQWQGAQQVMVGHIDVDWAGDKEARRSTSGGCVTIGTLLGQRMAPKPIIGCPQLGGKRDLRDAEDRVGDTWTYGDGQRFGICLKG